MLNALRRFYRSGRLAWIFLPLPLLSLAVFVFGHADTSTGTAKAGDWLPALLGGALLGTLGASYLREAAERNRLAMMAYYLILLWLLSFASAYWAIGADGFGEHPLTRLDALYFATTVGSTTGFGDISPHSQLARGMVTAQMWSGFILLIFGLSSVVGLVRRGPQDT